VVRSAFTFIELVFAIVLISIAVLSLPVMKQVVSSNTESGLVQEAIFAAATELNEASTAHWDEGSIDAGLPNAYARVIDTNGLCETNSSSPRYKKMPGHVIEPLHRKCLANDLGVLGTNTNNAVKALEDMAHLQRDIFLNPAVSKNAYKDTYKSTLTVTQNASFGGTTNNKNIKKITVTIRNSKNKILSRLVSYSANIGEVDFYKKAY